MNKDFMTLEDASKEELSAILDLADFYKKNRSDEVGYLATQSIGLIFLKHSTRTRISFEVGVQELGGRALYLDQNGLQIGRGESLEDTANVLSGYLHGIVIRGYEHSEIADFAKACSIPVINALTDQFHPCQLLADLQLLRWSFADLSKPKVAFLGDASSNMANSWILASKIFGFDLALAAPQKYCDDNILNGKTQAYFTQDAKEAVDGADFVYTDVWVSMGQENEKEQRLREMIDYQVNSDLLKCAKSDVKVMHCLPAYRGYEITDEVLKSENCVIWSQAENRLHAQKALMTKLFKR